jgi:type II secretory pathway component PulF
MLFSSRLPLSSLIDTCRTLRHYLGAGLTMRDVFRQLARKGPRDVQPMARRVLAHVEQGESLEDALAHEKALLPPLFLSLATVGEQTGNLPEIFRELEQYFILQQRLRRQFWSQSFWPIFQFFTAIFVIAGMIYLIGILTPSGSKPFDPLGFGLTGTTGAGIFLAIALGTVAAVVAGFLVATRLLKQGARVDAFLLRVPALGPCLRALALTRYCLAQRLTLETGMPIKTAVRLSLSATGNAAFTAAADVVLAGIKRGDELTACLAQARLFPTDFLHMLAVGEERGRLTEILEHQGDYYQEESSRRLTALTQAASWGVWLLTALFIIFLIFRIALTYIGLLEPSRYGLP